MAQARAGPDRVGRPLSQTLDPAPTGRRRIQPAVAITVAVGCAIIFFSGGVRSGFGLFITHLEDETGWTTAQISLGLALQNLMWGVGQPVAGAIADRYGSGRVLALGGVLYVAGVELMGHSTSPGQWVLSSGVLV